VPVYTYTGGDLSDLANSVLSALGFAPLITKIRGQPAVSFDFALPLTVDDLALLNQAMADAGFNGTNLGTTMLSMTTAERDALAPLPGSVCWNTDLPACQMFRGGAWRTYLDTSAAGPTQATLAAPETTASPTYVAVPGLSIVLPVVGATYDVRYTGTGNTTDLLRLATFALGDTASGVGSVIPGTERPALSLTPLSLAMGCYLVSPGGGTTVEVRFKLGAGIPLADAVASQGILQALRVK
jgi:hypothetical protein